MSSAAYGPGDGGASAYDDPNLCRWTKVDAEEAAQAGADVEEDEWFVLVPSGNAGEHDTVDVLSKKSGRITRVILGEEVSYCKFRVARRVGVVHGGDDDEAVTQPPDPDDFRWHPNDDESAACRWLVRGETGRSGDAVIVTSSLGRQTAVFLIREVGTAGIGAGLYEFARC